MICRDTATNAVISHSNPFGQCYDIKFEEVKDWYETEERYEETATDVLISIAIGILTAGIASYRPIAKVYRRDHRTIRTWIANSCQPEEKRDVIEQDFIISDWYVMTRPMPMGPDKPVTGAGGIYIFGIPIDDLYVPVDFGFTLSYAIPLDDVKPPIPDKARESKDKTNDLDSNNEGTTESHDAPSGDKIYLLGYDDLNSDIAVDNYLAVKGHKPEQFLIHSKISGKDLLNGKFKPAMINGSKWGSVHLDPRLNYEIVDASFKNTTSRVIQDYNLIPIKAKYGYWVLTLKQLSD